MKRSFLFSLALLISSGAVAQTLHVDVLQQECNFINDSLVIKLSLSGNVNDLNTRGAILLTPYLCAEDDNANIDLPYIQINGKYKQILHVRNNELKNRMGNEVATPKAYIQGISANNTFEVDYRTAVAIADLQPYAALQIRCESLNIGDEIDEIANVYVRQIERPGSTHIIHTTPSSSVADESEKPYIAQKPSPAQEPSASCQSSNYKGSYTTPETDATDERNQRDLNFSLEEARVMVNINPQILSLKELFTVAMSYKEDRDKFYHIILTCVKLYPTHPTANLNAASMAIELGDKEAANKYLQIVPYESLAYKNCRGAYELMNGNIYEGIRLLKSAKAEGSEEAGYNLDLFFELNK